MVRSPMPSTAENTSDEYYTRNINDYRKSMVVVQPQVSSSYTGAKQMASLTKQEAKMNKRFMDPGKSGFDYKNSIVGSNKNSS